MKQATDRSAAYAATCFEAMTPEGLVSLRIGEENPMLAKLMVRREAASASFITAWNPGSRLRSHLENDGAHAQLLQLLVSREVTCYEGYGRDPRGQWAPERSVLVLGITEVEACEIGRRFGQSAIVTVGADRIPRLRWLEEETSPGGGLNHSR
jgi:hypothetical protein